MQIAMQQAGKKFNREWIFRKLSFVFEEGKRYAITGPNGSGKSTLLQTIAGSMNLSEGAIQYNSINNQRLHEDSVHTNIAIAAPYLEVVEEMTAKEFLHFHLVFKPLLPDITVEKILAIIGLEKAAGKQIRYYSSGMKQRIKLAQAIFSDTPVLLLDEPCTNLDNSGYALYHSLIENYCAHKTIIVSSNDENEMDFCTTRLSILDYK